MNDFGKTLRKICKEKVLNLPKYNNKKKIQYPSFACTRYASCNFFGPVYPTSRRGDGQPKTKTKTKTQSRGRQRGRRTSIIRSVTHRQSTFEILAALGVPNKSTLTGTHRTTALHCPPINQNRSPGVPWPGTEEGNDHFRGRVIHAHGHRIEGGDSKGE